MDVRCEKCQTEYELDEARLKPGGVTVKCTNCGHMFKIRKRAITNVGAPPPADQRPRTASSRPPPAGAMARSQSMFDEAPTARANNDEGPTTVDRQWQIRLENGDQKSCRELAVLQQWIVAGVVTRESLISRTGKTWKRLGDIAELTQYFDIADEARTTREARPTGRATPMAPPKGALAQGLPPPPVQAAPPPPPPQNAPAPQSVPAPRGTMIGVGAVSAPQAAGGTILPDDDDDPRAGRGAPPPLPPKVPLGAKTPPMGSIAAPPPPPTGSPSPVRRAAPTPPPPPVVKRTPPEAVPVAPPPPPTRVPVARPPTPPPIPSTPVHGRAAPTPSPVIPRPPPDGRATAAWASEPVRPVDTSSSQSGPSVGKLSAIPDEPAFAAGAGRVRPMDPEAGFETGRVTKLDEDDDLLPPRRGSRAGLWIVLALLAFGGAAGAGIYLFVIKDKGKGAGVATGPSDAQGSAGAPDAAVAIAQAPDAAEALTSPLDATRGELLADNEARLRTAFESLAAKDDAAAQAVRANLGAALAQALTDRAGLVADRAEAEKLRREATRLAIDAATAAQRAQKTAPDDAGANVAMAAVLRLQGKPPAAIKRYTDAARAKADKVWTRDAALADALVLARDGKLEEARAALAAIDQGEGKLETSNDVRARFHLALIALAQGKTADAKPLVAQVLAAQPEHAAARALVAKLDATVVKSDPLPPEEPKGSGGGGSGSGGSATVRPPPPDVPVVSGGESYDKLLARANALADSNCTAAMTLYNRALEQRPNGVEALTGMGYCHIDSKQFASAFGKFRAAIAVSPRYEPALWGVGEAYQQQGRKEQAIEAFQRYLEVYPGSPKALRQLERLGASPGGASPGGGSAAPTPTPTPTPTPPPTPTPTEPAAGSGSG